jgi:hypothetical protein
MIAPQPCIRWTSKDPDHDATYASAAKLRGGGPNLISGIEARNHSGITTTSDRYRQSVCSAEISCCLTVLMYSPDSGRYATQLEIRGYDAGRNDAPEDNR